ncbi:MAG: GAF domain-containing protein, partial [Gaiellales bacterium]
MATAGRESVHEPLDPSRIVDAASVRIVAAALTGGTVDARALDGACDSFAADPDGVERISAMVRRATRALRSDAEPGSDTESIPVERAVRIAGVHGSLIRAIARRRDDSERAYERFAAAVTDVAEADGFEDACRRAADALVQLSGMPVAAVYVPGPEHARMVRASRDSSLAMLEDGAMEAAERRDDGEELQRTFDTPPAVRIDRGLFADVVAGERPVFVSQRDPIDSIPGEIGARTLVAVPMRDAIGRPVGMLLALDERTRELDVQSVESIRRLAGVVAGELGTAAAMRRSRAALGTLPSLADTAHSEQLDINAQLEELARIVTRATDSDSAVIRVRDSAGRFLETRAVISTHGDAVADAIGTRTQLSDDHPAPADGGTSRAAISRRLRAAASIPAEFELDDTVSAKPEAPTLRVDLDHAEIGFGEHELVGLEEPPDTWSPQGQRILRELSARTVASFPIESRYGRHAVLYVVRTTARPFDDVDRACIRIVTAHAQHVIDRYVSEQQTERAIDAARNAVMLLGEALVAGVRAERTLRFVPRLFHEMFGGQGVRAWRRDHDEVLALVAGSGHLQSTGATDALLSAFERPLQLELDTRT